MPKNVLDLLNEGPTVPEAGLSGIAPESTLLPAPYRAYLDALGKSRSVVKPDTSEPNTTGRVNE